MAYVPQFTITPALPNEVERVAALRERMQSAAVYLAWIPALQKDARTRSVHASALETIRHDDVLELHRILAGAVMDQGEAGRYRTIGVRVGDYLPPPADAVSGLMFELLEWWNTEAAKLSPVLISAILHHRFESIHPQFLICPIGIERRSRHTKGLS